MAADQDLKRSDEAKRGAVKTLLELAIERSMVSAGEREGQQISLFSEGDALPDDSDEGKAGTKRGPGRPPGAQNRATESFRRFVRARFGDPFLKLMEMAFSDPKVLCTVLGAPSVWEVAKQQQEWRRWLMPYLHSAMPQELKVSAKGYLAVAIGATPGALPAGDQVHETDPFAALLEMMPNQGLSKPIEDVSYADVSYVSPNPSVETKG